MKIRGLLLLLLIYPPILQAMHTPCLRIHCFLSAIWGKPTQSQIVFLPGGFHFASNNSNLNNQQWFIALNIQGFIGGTFLSSSGRRIFFGGLERLVYQSPRFEIDYLIGIMQGYRAEGLEHLPSILKHDPGPVTAVRFTYLLTPELGVSVATYGVGALLGVRYVLDRHLKCWFGPGCSDLPRLLHGKSESGVNHSLNGSEEDGRVV